MTTLLLIGVPLAALVLAFLAVHWLSTPVVVRISTAAMLTQAALAILALTLEKALPEKENVNGQMCPVDGRS